MGKPVIMGRKTYESIGKPLLGRLNIVITSQKMNIDGVTVVKSIDKAIYEAYNSGADECFIIGGGTIYNQTIDLADKIYLTRVESKFDGDTYFPEIEELKWTLSEKTESVRVPEEPGLTYHFEEYTKI